MNWGKDTCIEYEVFFRTVSPEVDRTTQRKLLPIENDFSYMSCVDHDWEPQSRILRG